MSLFPPMWPFSNCFLVLSTLTAKINAIKMLSRRIALLRSYLDSLPPSYLSDPSIPLTAEPTTENALALDHSILRSISATLARINILSPPSKDAFTLEAEQEASDVQLISLLSSITDSITAAKQLGIKSEILQQAQKPNTGRGSATTDYMDITMGGVSAMRGFGEDGVWED